MSLRDLWHRLRTLVSLRRADRDLADELAFHVDREIHRLVSDGVDPREARRRALATFGSVAATMDDARDARGLSFIDDTRRDVLYAFRAFRRAPLAALTIVVTVALGLGLVAVVFSFLSVFLFRVDRVQRPSELFGVERLRTSEGDRPPLFQGDADAVRRETDVFVDMATRLPDIDSRIDGRMMAGTLVSGNFFPMLGVRAALGRTLTPADDDPAVSEPVVVLSHRGWIRRFSSDRDVVGKAILINNRPYHIVGVMPEGVRGLDVSAPDYWMPLSRLGDIRPAHRGREDRVAIDVVGRLKPGVTRATALAALVVWDSRRNASGGATIAAATTAAANITLTPRQGTVPQPDELVIVFAPIFFAFGLILTIGCANVANLLLARAVARQREIGIRLSLGASRRRLIRQLLTESLLLALAAAALGYAVSRGVLNAAAYAISTTLAPEFAETINIAVPSADWRVIVFLIVGALVSTVFFGLAPALQATRLDLTQTIRGELNKGLQQGRARTVLIGIQVTASALLLICAGVFLRSAASSARVDPGFRTSDTVLIEVLNDATRQEMVQAVTAQPMIAAVAASRPDALSRPRETFVEAVGAPTSRGRSSYRFVSPDYFDVLGIDVLHGRAFNAGESLGNVPVAIVTESLARRMWPGGGAVGQVLNIDPDPGSPTRPEDETPLPGRAFPVVGVIRDVPGFRVAGFAEAEVYLPTSVSHPRTTLVVRVNGDVDQARRDLLQQLTKVDPNMGQVVSLRTLAQFETYVLRSGFWLTLILGALALALTLSGLFSVLSYLVEQRRREIGVRMALGATTMNIGMLVVRQGMRPVAIGLVAGASAAVGLGAALMATPIAAQIGQIVKLFDPVAYLASITYVIVACVVAALIPALRASRIDPIATIREM